jgi:hypothetical protein
VNVGVVAAYQLEESMPVTSNRKATEIKELANTLVVHAFPNPATANFSIKTESGSAAPLSMRVTDATGRVVEAFQNLPANSRVQFGARYLPGVYYAEVRQGNETKMVTLVKKRE